MTSPSFSVDHCKEPNLHAILRYAPMVAGLLRQEDLQATSQREGFRLIQLEPYHGVDLFLLDETTGMKTGTYKSLDGCISTAFSKRLGYKSVVFSSGANAGCALTDYADKVGIETFFFCPSTTLYKMDGALFESPLSHLIAIEGTDRRVKAAAQLFSEMFGVPLIPRLEWRLLSASFRSYFVAEKMQERKSGFSWFSQAICAGFGPIGFYQSLHTLATKGIIPETWIPRFLGIQQAGLAPIASAWSRGLAHLSQSFDTRVEETIEPALYNTFPSQTYPMLFDVLRSHGGDIVALSPDVFEKHVDKYVDLLNQAGIPLTTLSRNGRTEYLEKAGLLAGAGTLKAIDEGAIKKGETVLCSLTGGSGPGPRKEARPEYYISGDSSLAIKLKTYMNQISTQGLGRNTSTVQENDAHLPG